MIEYKPKKTDTTDPTMDLVELSMMLKTISESISFDEILILKRELDSIYTKKSAEHIKYIKKNIRIGDVVEINTPKLTGKSGTVIKLNHKNVIWKVDDGTSWRIPYQYIILPKMKFDLI